MENLAAISILKSITYWAIARILLFPRCIFNGVSSAFRAYSHLSTIIVRPWTQRPGGSKTAAANDAIDTDTGGLSGQSPKIAISPEHSNSPSTLTAVPIFDLPLDRLDGGVLSIDELATPCRFRLLDCSAFVDPAMPRLLILEYPVFALEELRYAAISYPWRDLQLLPPGLNPPEGSFTVKGAEHADQISIDVLRTACLAAIHLGSTALWLDRLCILQSRKDDKNWQIQRMFRIYARCDPCLILPGGLVRLAGLSEPTSWADRAWTLQEACAPKKLKCVFSFPHDTYSEFAQQECISSGFSLQFLDFLNHSESPIQEILEPRRSAVCDLLVLLRVTKTGTAGFRYHEPVLSQQYDKFPVRIVHTPAATILYRALQVTKSPLTLWKSAYTRSSSRPVDMVLSFMDLLGVNLDVSQFGPDDRVRATIALIKEYMARGNTATWLYIAPTLPPAVELSTLPTFPATTESGGAFINTQGGKVPAFAVLGAEQSWESAGAPKGRMSDAGYFQFAGTAVRVLRGLGQAVEGVEYGGLRPAMSRAYDTAETYGIVIGSRNEYNKDYREGGPGFRRPGPVVPVMEVTLMFVERHGFDLFRRVGMERYIDEKATAQWCWIYREFSVGGPGGRERVRFEVTPEGPTPITASM